MRENTVVTVQESNMRIIAGEFKGIQLRVGHGPFYRPTAQIVRGSIFDTISPEIKGATFCDLFAGSGAVGIEALSRGAQKVTFVEQDRRVLRALRSNLSRCGIGRDRVEVKIGDVFRFINRIVKKGEFYDFIFADPPYTANVAQKVLSAFEAAGKQVCETLIIEHGEPIYLSENTCYELRQAKKFGQIQVSYFSFKGGR